MHDSVALCWTNTLKINKKYHGMHDLVALCSNTLKINKIWEVITKCTFIS